MQGAPSPWQNHLPHISPAVSPAVAVRAELGWHREQQGEAGEGAGTHALGIIPAWKRLCSCVCDPNKNKSSDDLHHWVTRTKQGTKAAFWGG